MTTREHHYVLKVTKLWYRSIVMFAKRKAGERNLTLADARSYCEREMGKEIREHISKTLGLEVEEVETMWANRTKHAGAADAEQYYYGVGSWVLGEEAIIKDTKQAKVQEQNEKDDKKSEKDKEMERLRKRIQEAIRRMRRQGPQAGGQQKKEVTPDSWWEEASRDVRLSFIKAYYVEHSGDLEIINAYVDNCPNCGGRGRITEQMAQGRPRLVKCGVCHGTRFKRRIRGK